MLVGAAIVGFEDFGAGGKVADNDEQRSQLKDFYSGFHLLLLLLRNKYYNRGLKIIKRLVVQSMDANNA